jgi:hypothetical protein
MLLDDIGVYLQSHGIGEVGVDIFKGAMPDSPDKCICLYEYAGEPLSLDWDGENPGLQVMVRDKSYEQGRLKINRIQNTLHGINNTTINGTRYLLVHAQQSPESLGRDENNRCEFVINFRVIKEVNIS